MSEYSESSLVPAAEGTLFSCFARKGDDAMMFSNAAPPLSTLTSTLVQDLLRSLQDHVDSCSMTDVYLISAGDKTEIPANRFVLAARSPVLSKMLYGEFRESSLIRIDLPYSARLLQVIVKYCNTDEVDSNLFQFEVKPKESNSLMRFLVDIANAADFLELMDLHLIMLQKIHYFMTKYLSLSIDVFDQSDDSSALSNMALHLIETRPYIVFSDDVSAANSDVVGIECLSPNKLICLFKSSSIAASELYLFRLLQRWFQHHRDSEESLALETAQKCCRYIHWVNIEPQILLETVSSCQFCPSEHVFAAIAQQALQASQRGVWNLRCRGKRSNTVERLLVEDCGLRDAQGIYYRVMGLAQGIGGLFTKRETSAGQEWVYTISCAVKDDRYDCRLFRSKLLTAGAISALARIQHTSQSRDHIVFQPVVQVLGTKKVCSSGHPVADSSHQLSHVQVQLSDGEYYMSATLSDDIALVLDHTSFPVIKLMEYGAYFLHGHASFHVTKVSVLHSTLGLSFGDVKPFSSVAADHHRNTPENLLPQHPVELLYTCSTSVHATRDRNAPCSRVGWEANEELLERVREHEALPPSVLWMDSGAIHQGTTASSMPLEGLIRSPIASSSSTSTGSSSSTLIGV